jgi:hypothetical protein
MVHSVNNVYTDLVDIGDYLMADRFNFKIRSRAYVPSIKNITLSVVDEKYVTFSQINSFRTLI